MFARDVVDLFRRRDVQWVPLTYMQLIDGKAYALGGAAGSFVADAVLSGVACVLLALLYWRFAARPAAA